MENHLVTITEAAQYINMSITHVRKLVERGDIPSRDTNGEKVILIGDLVEFDKKRHEDAAELRNKFANYEKSSIELDDVLADLI